jgi:regulator of protease activity HflC (stomatin/prohibitin superfamily)
VINDYERAVMLRFGRRLHEKPLKGGVHFLLPCVEELKRIDCREQMLDIPRQTVITREKFELFVDAVVFYRINDAHKALLGLKGNVANSVMSISQTQLRATLGLYTFQTLQMNRDLISLSLKKSIDEATDTWGVDVTRVEITDVKLPANLATSMASEANAKLTQQAVLIAADRDARAMMIQAASSPVLVNAEREATARFTLAEADAQCKVINAQAEKDAADLLTEAADIMNQSQGSMALKYMQTLPKVQGKIVAPLPSGMLDLMKA